MNKPLLAGLMLALISTASQAAEKTGGSTEKSAVAGNPAKAAKIVKPAGKTSTDVDVKDGLDIIGSQDAPLELNIVPWKDKDNVLPKNPLEASMLKEVLEPIDRDVVRREVDYSRAIQTFPTPSP